MGSCDRHEPPARKRKREKDAATRVKKKAVDSGRNEYGRRATEESNLEIREWNNKTSCSGEKER